MALAALQAHPDLGRLGAADLLVCLQHARRRRLPRYATAYREGAEAPHLLVLLKGTLAHLNARGERILLSPLTADEVGGARGVCFGLEALVRGSSSDGGSSSGGSTCGGDGGGNDGGGNDGTCALRRQHTMSAVSDCIVLQLPVEELHCRIGPRRFGPVLGAAFSRFVRSELATVRVLHSNLPQPLALPPAQQPLAQPLPQPLPQSLPQPLASAGPSNAPLRN